MSHYFQVSAGELGTFSARHGETLLAAALLNGVDLPHDCQAGHCGSCRCNVVTGTVAGGETGETGAILACQARVMSDLVIAVEETPPIEIVPGRLRAITELSGDVIELVITPKRPMDILPGQYVQLGFSGFPARCYSPTLPLKGPIDDDAFRLHVRRRPNGCVSSALGASIRPGHKVRIAGPYGTAFLRTGLANRLVLVSSGTGFAPIWSIAHAALCEAPDREIVVVVAARDRGSLYMAGALLRLAAFPKVTVTPVIRKRDRPDSAFWIGEPLVFMPRLTGNDIVYASGGPLMVEGVFAIALGAGARCYVDPFAPALPDAAFSFEWARSLLTAGPLRTMLRRPVAVGRTGEEQLPCEAGSPNRDFFNW